MAHMLELADKDFRSTIIAMFKKLQENMLTMNEQKTSAEKQRLKNNQVENTVLKFKKQTNLNGLNSRLKMT